MGILCEPQWKPSTEEQAISRIYLGLYQWSTVNDLDKATKSAKNASKVA